MEASCWGPYRSSVLSMEYPELALIRRQDTYMSIGRDLRSDRAVVAQFPSFATMSMNALSDSWLGRNLPYSLSTSL